MIVDGSIRQAYAKIGKSLDVAHRSIIAGAGTAPEAWLKLVGQFDRKDELNLIELGSTVKG